MKYLNKNLKRKSAFTLIEVLVATSLILFLLTVTVSIIKTSTVSSKNITNDATDLSNANLAMKEILTFLEENDGLYTLSDVTTNKIIARANTRYVYFDSSTSMLYVNRTGSTTDYNTPIPLSLVKFECKLNSYNKYIIIVTVKSGNVSLNTAYLITLR